jgi:hypothetical protein
MIKTEFGIIDEINYSKDYGYYNPKEYDCIFIDDAYLDDWWNQLKIMKTYFHSTNRPEFALARCGVTLIPSESLPVFQDIVITDKRLKTDSNLVALSDKIQEAIDKNKFMIHFGI